MKINGQKNIRWREYKKLLSKDFEKIESKFGKDCDYICLWKYQSDRAYTKYSYLLNMEFNAKNNLKTHADIIISPRKREARAENNFRFFTRSFLGKF